VKPPTTVHILFLGYSKGDMAIPTEVIVGALTLLTAIVGLFAGIKIYSRRQKNKNQSKTSVNQFGIGKVKNQVGNIGGATFKVAQNANEDKNDES